MHSCSPRRQGWQGWLPGGGLLSEVVNNNKKVWRGTVLALRRSRCNDVGMLAVWVLCK